MMMLLLQIPTNANYQLRAFTANQGPLCDVAV